MDFEHCFNISWIRLTWDFYYPEVRKAKIYFQNLKIQNYLNLSLVQIIYPETPTSLSKRIHFSYFNKTQTFFSVDAHSISIQDRKLTTHA